MFSTARGAYTRDMTRDELEASVADWATDYPESIPVFQQFGVDYCCGGKSLEYACRQSGVDPREFLTALRRVIDLRGGGEGQSS